MRAEERLALAFVGEHAEDAARLLEQVSPADAAAFLARIPPAMAATVCSALGPSTAAACAAELSDVRLAAIVEGMPLDVASAMLRRVAVARVAVILQLVGPERRERLRSLLEYPENTAGALADPEVVALPVDVPAEEARRQLRDVPGHLLNYVYVLERDRKLAGTLNIQELMAAPAKKTLAAVMQKDPVRLDANADIATVAAHAAWRDFDALPVVDTGGKLIGAIRHKVIRRMSGENAQTVVATLVGLSEMYWAGLSGIIVSLAPSPPKQEEEHGQ